MVVENSQGMRRRDMKVHDVMTPEVIMVGPEASLAEAAQLMKQQDIGPLPVCENERVFGMVTDRDITVRAVAEGRDPHSTRVRDVMTPDLVCCFENDDIEEAARLMQETQLRRLLVIDDDRRLVGIVSLADIVQQTGDDSLGGETLERVTDPTGH
jgi:CBS domain-containing protein